MKNLKLKLTFLSLCAFATAAHAQQVKGNSVLYTSSQGNMRIEMCSESMFRVTKVPAQQMPDNEKWMVVNYNFPQVDFSVDGKQIKTSKLQVSIQEAPWRIQVADASGKVLYEELTSGCKDSIYNEAKLTPDKHIETKYGLGTIRNLSSGCKTLLNIVKHPDKVVNVEECGPNVLKIIFTMDNIKIYMSRPSLFDIPDDVQIRFNDSDIVTGGRGYNAWWSKEYERREADDL